MILAGRWNLTTLAGPPPVGPAPGAPGSRAWPLAPAAGRLVHGPAPCSSPGVPESPCQWNPGLLPHMDLACRSSGFISGVGDTTRCCGGGAVLWWWWCCAWCVGAAMVRLRCCDGAPAVLVLRCCGAMPCCWCWRCSAVMVRLWCWCCGGAMPWAGAAVLMLFLCGGPCQQMLSPPALDTLSGKFLTWKLKSGPDLQERMRNAQSLKSAYFIVQPGVV